jgi:hypothetical protein
MHLTDEQRGLLQGDRGRATAKAMEVLVALGEVFGAERLLPVTSAQVSGVSFANLGDEGLAFLEELARDGRAVVPATLNPAGMDLERPERMGLPAAFIGPQRRVIDAYRRLGIAASCTCTPYLAGNLPAPGDTLAWSESSAVTFANSVLGARTNREGGPSALASALTGYTPAYGLHLAAERRPTVEVRVSARLSGQVEWGALGMLVGRRAGDRIPLIVAEDRPGLEELKTFCAALPTYGGASLFHLVDVTPEADRHARPAGAVAISGSDLRSVLAEARQGREAPDLVCLGCPHASLAELQEVAAGLAGRKVAVDFWICTSRAVKALADDLGLTGVIEVSGAMVVTDTCFVVAPLRGIKRSIATNSAKGVFYASGQSGLDTHLLPTAECVEVAVTGRIP